MTAPWLPPPWSIPSPLPGPIRTKRTVVRRYQAGDGARLFEAVDTSRQALLPWMAWARHGHQTEAESEAYVQRCVDNQGAGTCRDFPMGIFDRETGRLLGGTGLHELRPGVGEAEIGYWIRSDSRGRGLCTEAVEGLLAAALRSPDEKDAGPGWGLRRVVICNGTTNHPSRRVCEKLGLHLEGTLRKARYIGPPGEGPGWYDVNVFSRLADDR